MSLADKLHGAKSSQRMPAGEDSRMNAARDAFLGALSGVLVEPPVFHFFAGAIERDAASSIWAWMARDIAQAEAARLGDAIEAGADPLQAFDEVLPDLLGRLKENAAAEKEDRELERRNSMQMGGEEARRRLPSVIVAMRRRPLLVQAERFGVAVGTIADEATLAAALQS